MNVLIGCEESQEVCKAFRARGHNAFSCDIQPCSGGHPEWHIQGDLLQVLTDGWDMMIAHPPCTYISYAGTQSWNNPGRVFKRLEALQFFAMLWECPIPRICLENPKSCASPTIAKYTQEIQPCFFGDRHFKTTWLWLKNLPPLKFAMSDNLFELATATETPEPVYIDNTERRKKRYFTDGLSSEGLRRSKTFPGIARAMAEQWGNLE